MPNYDDPRLSPINEERNRVARAIDDADWDGEFDEADALRQELRHIDALRDKGELYVPNFQRPTVVLRHRIDGVGYLWSRLWSILTMMTDDGEDDDPTDDVTHWVGNLPEPSTDSTERTDKRNPRRTKQSDVQRKELPVAKGKET